MSRFEVRFQHCANFLVAFSGLLYGYFRYFVTSKDPFSAAPHPLEPWMQGAHIFVAPLLVFAVGLIWNGHIEENYRNSKSPRRVTGISLVFLLIPMVVTGYLIQISVADMWRKSWAVAHWGFSGLWLAGYLGHLVTPKVHKRSSKKSRS